MGDVQVPLAAMRLHERPGPQVGSLWGGLESLAARCPVKDRGTRGGAPDPSPAPALVKEAHRNGAARKRAVGDHRILHAWR